MAENHFMEHEEGRVFHEGTEWETNEIHPPNMFRSMTGITTGATHATGRGLLLQG